MAGLRVVLFAAVLCTAALSVQANRNARIVGGVASDISAAPWMVQQLFVNNGRIIPWCGGVIISDRHILTAGHCMHNKDQYTKDPEKNIKVLVGATVKYNGSDEGTMYRVKSVKLNPDYTKRGGFLWLETKKVDRHDVAILETVEPIQFNDKVQPLQISNEKPAADTLVYVGGWGINTETGSTSFNPSMHITASKVMSDAACQQYLTTFKGMAKESQEWLVCTKNIDGTPCQGDSGGPLWSHVEGQPPRLIGLVQSGRGCTPKEPGLYVDIADPEIKKFLKKNKIEF